MVGVGARDGDLISTKLLIIIILGFLALIVSVHLVKEHFEDSDESYCDLNSHISCSKVRRSVFSELFNVPVALFGALYNLVTIALALKAYSETFNGAYISALFYWSVFGAIFIFYLIFAEILLQAICPACTVLHVIQFTIVYISWKIYNTKSNLPNLQQTILELKYWVLVIGIINFIPIIYYNFMVEEPVLTDVPKEFCDCVTFAGWRFYGREGCMWCEKQKMIFGESIKYIIFIDCLKVPDTCKQLNIEGFPTWIRFSDDGEELQRYKGYSTLKNLAEISHCSIPAEFLEP
jgi:uncharacterized membrane protein